MPELEQEFTPGFLRKVLAQCVRAGLHTRVPGACNPEHFAGLSSGPPGPRRRLAALIEAHAKDAPGEWPGVETMDLLVEQEVQRIRAPEEAALVRQEWEAVKAVEVTDAGYVEQRVAEWAARTAIQRLILSTADLYQGGASSADLRAHLSEGVREADTQRRGTLSRLLGTYKTRVALWERGEELGVRVPTGLRPLDLALSGGVRPGEVMYALAPPKGAKTTFLLNLALNAARRGHGVAFFSYEMGATPMMLRMDRNVAKATKADLREDTTRLVRAYRGLIVGGAGEVYLWTGAPQERGACEGAQRVVEEIRREGGRVDLVVFDFLNIMGSARDEREKRHELARVSREISAAAKALGVAVWSAALVKRTAIAKAKLRKDDIAESFEVIAVADGVVGICAPDELVLLGQRSLYLAALREDGDDRAAGVYHVDLDRMMFREAKGLDAAVDEPGGGG